MRIKEGFVIREVMGNYVAVAVGEASKSFRGMIKLNGTAAYIWRMIEKGMSEDEICLAMLEEYDVDRDQLVLDVHRTIEDLREKGFVEE